MKKTARILAVLMAVLLGIATTIPALAAPNDATPSPGLPFEKGSLTLTKFIMDDLADATTNGTGGEIGDTNPNTGDSLAIIPAGAKTLGNVDFKVYQIDFSTYTDAHGNLNNTPLDSIFRQLMDEFNKLGFILIGDYDNPTHVESAQESAPGVRYRFPVTQVVNGNGVTGFTGTGVNSVLKTSDVAGTGHGTAKASNLNKGFYLVVEQLSDKVASHSFPFIVSVPMTNATGTGWIQNVFAYPKNGDISIEKEIDRNAVFVGEEVNFTVTVSVPADIRTYRSFYMTDILDEAVDYKTGSMQVYGMTSATDPGTLIAASTASPARDNFTVNLTPTATTPVKNTLEVKFVKKASTATGTPYPGSFQPPVGWNESREIDGDGFWTLGLYKFVRFEFTGYINDKILSRIGTDSSTGADLNGAYPEGEQHWAYTLFNEAEINFRNKFETGADRKRKSKTVRTHSAAILLEKRDANTKEPLAGAEFKIASTEQNARDGKFLKKVTTQFAVNGVTYKVGAILDAGNAADALIIANAAATGNTADWVEASKIITAADAPAYLNDAALWTYVQGKAIVRFQGLKEFGNWGATKGSTVVASDMEDVNKSVISYPPATESNKYLTYWVVETKTPTPDYNLLLEPIKVEFVGRTKSNFANWYTVNGGIVNNTNKFTLPETGGVGTILFTAGGIALIVVAAFLFVMSMRKKKASEG